jgi:hypothetical protein
MANLQAPKGFVDVSSFAAGSISMRGNMYYIAAADTNQFNPGDAVVSAAVSDGNGIMGVTKNTTGTGLVRGVILGCYIAPPNNPSIQGTNLDLTVQNIPATKTKAYYVLVQDNPEAVFELQDDGLNVLTATAVNKNASFTVTNPTAPGQYSATVLLTSSVATTQGLSLRLMGLSQRVNNGFGAYATWLVMFNQHELMGNTAGV